MIKAYAAPEMGKPFEAIEYDPGELRSDEVEIAVDYCGICHSDLSMLDNEWGMTAFPFVGGHEVVGRVARIGEHVPSVGVARTLGACKALALKIIAKRMTSKPCKGAF